MKAKSDKSFELYRKKLIEKEKNDVSVKRESMLNIALVFPNDYSVGMANLGFQTVYRLFNELDSISCERSFYYKEFPNITKTLESGRELRDFDIVAFSVSFELDIPNLVQVLINAGIEPRTEKRHSREPLVVCGGAVTFINPAPLEIFTDFMVVGEIEPQFKRFANLLLEKRIKGYTKSELSNMLAEVPGIFVPLLKNLEEPIKNEILPGKISSPQHSVIISPNSHFKNMFLIEVGRGCGRRCNFCAASHIYHPFRYFAPEQILAAIQNKSPDTKRIGLIGSAISDYPTIPELCERLVNHGYELGLSSFRLDRITPSFLQILEKGKVKSVTFAPEAGSERLRKIINKGLSHEAIISSANFIADSNINQIKLYFLIGLPGEEDSDINGIANLITEIHQVFFEKKVKKTITVSVNGFIPKPWTPFQWAKMETPNEIRRKRKMLATKIKSFPNVIINKKSIKEEMLQGVISLGDNNVGQAIYLKIKNKIDWAEAWREAGVNVDNLLYNEKTFDLKFPWESISVGIKKKILWQKWEASKK